MANDPHPTRLAEIDPWTVVEAARQDRAPVVAEGARTAVAWLYRGVLPSPGALATEDQAPPPPRQPTFAVLIARLGRRFGTRPSGSRPA